MRLDREETRVIRVAVEALILVLVQKEERAVLDNSRLEKQKNMVRWGIGSFDIVPLLAALDNFHQDTSSYIVRVSLFLVGVASASCFAFARDTVSPFPGDILNTPLLSCREDSVLDMVAHYLHMALYFFASFVLPPGSVFGVALV